MLSILLSDINNNTIVIRIFRLSPSNVRAALTLRSGQVINSALTRLANTYNYELEQHNGQRYFGPPIGCDIPTPSKECEIFIGGIPRDVFEDILIPMFYMHGTLYRFRLMMDFSGANRGFAFALYKTPEAAAAACRWLNKSTINGRGEIVCLPCNDNNSLFLGGIHNKSIYEIATIIFENTPAANSIAVTTFDDRNNCYVMIRFATHRDAALARRYYLVKKYELFPSKLRVIVDWKSRHEIYLPFQAYATKGTGGEYIISFSPSMSSESRNSRRG